MSEQVHPYCRCLYYAANALARSISWLGEDASDTRDSPRSLGFLLMVVNRSPGRRRERRFGGILLAGRLPITNRISQWIASGETFFRTCALPLDSADCGVEPTSADQGCPMNTPLY
jgi:hypothetical protein